MKLQTRNSRNSRKLPKLERVVTRKLSKLQPRNKESITRMILHSPTSEHERARRFRVIRAICCLVVGFVIGVKLEHSMAHIVADGMIAAALDVILLGGEA